MSNTEKFKALFPLKGELTQTIIDNANLYDMRNCRGAMTLRAALGENEKLLHHGVSWGSYKGFNKISEEDEDVYITTVGKINFMKTDTPQSVTFIILN